MNDLRHMVLVMGLALVTSGCQPAPAPLDSAQASPVVPTSEPTSIEAAAAPSVELASSPTSPAPDEVVAAEWCRVTGAAGALLRCPLSLAVQGTTPVAAGLQMSVAWDASHLALVGVESRVCPPGSAAADGPEAGCVSAMSPPLKSVGSAGHALATRPVDVSTASGAATLMLYHPSNPNALIDTEVGSVVFRALVDVVDTQVNVSEAVATSPQAKSLTVKAAKGLLHVGSL